MITSDLEHKLLSGGVIYIGDCPTYSISLKQMADCGFSTMQNVISLMALDDTQVSNIVKEDGENASTYHALVATIIHESQHIPTKTAFLCNSILVFLSMFFRRDVFFEKKYGFLVKDENETTIFVLNEKNYDQFRNVLKYRNCLADVSDEENENPANKMAAQLLAKRKMLREKIHKSKKNMGEDSISMADLISIFAEAESMSLQDVYDRYDMYQFNNQFNRLKIMDDFHVNIQALLAGAKSEDVKLQHWLSKIKKDEQ